MRSSRGLIIVQITYPGCRHQEVLPNRVLTILASSGGQSEQFIKHLHETNTAMTHVHVHAGTCTLDGVHQFKRHAFTTDLKYCVCSLHFSMHAYFYYQHMYTVHLMVSYIQPNSLGLMILLDNMVTCSCRSCPILSWIILMTS